MSAITTPYKFRNALVCVQSYTLLYPCHSTTLSILMSLTCSYITGSLQAFSYCKKLGRVLTMGLEMTHSETRLVLGSGGPYVHKRYYNIMTK